MITSEMLRQPYEMLGRVTGVASLGLLANPGGVGELLYEHTNRLIRVRGEC